jgi:dynactin complex subunit
MLYMQNKQTETDLKTAQNNIAKLQSQASSASKAQVDQLTEENATLQKTINQQNDYIDALTKTAQALKTKCGTACSSITIPPNPVSVTPTPTPTPTATPTPAASPTPTPTR